MLKLRRLGFASLVVFVFFPGAFSGTVAFAAPESKAEARTLPNGLTVIVEEMPVSPVVTVSVFYKVGSREEIMGATGVSHFVEHMLFNGTEKYPKNEAFKTIMKNGGIGNGLTFWDYTLFYDMVPSDKLDLALEIEADRMANSLMDSLAIEEERDIILEELAMRTEAPIINLIEETFASAFKVHPYHHWYPGGNEADVQNITPDEVKAFYKKYYSPNNAIVAVVGNIEKEQAFERVSNFFGSIGSQGEPKRQISEEPEQKGLRRVQLKAVSKESQALFFIKGPEFGTRDWEILQVVTQIVGGGKKSRLEKNVVDKGIASSVTFFDFPSKDPFGITIFISAPKDADMKTIETAVWNELEKLKNSPVTVDELERAKRMYAGQTLLGLQTSQERTQQLSLYEYYRGWRYSDELLENIKTITQDDVLSLAKKYFKLDKTTIGTLICSGSKNDRETISFNQVSGGRMSLPAFFAVGGYSKDIQTPHGRMLSFKDAVTESLPNGMRAILMEDHSLPLVAIGGYIMGGAVLDPQNEQGLANLTANMMTRGTKKYSYYDFHEVFEGVGSSFEMDGRLESIAFSTTVPADRAVASLDAISDALVNPTFPKGELGKAKNEISSLIRKRDDDAFSVAKEGFRGFFFGTHPYSHSVMGTEESISKMSHKDAVGFYQQNVKPNLTVLCIVGDFKKDEMMARIKENFSSWPGRRGGVECGEPVLASGVRQKVLTLPEKKQVKVILGTKGPLLRSDDFAAFSVMDLIFGDQAFGSRLFDKIREEKSLAYIISTEWLPTKEPSSYTIVFGTRSRGLEKALAAVREEITKMRSSAVSDTELADTKSFLKGILPFRFQTYSTIGNQLLQTTFHGLPLDFYERYAAALDSVGKEEVLEAARKYLDEANYAIYVVGPVDENLKAVRKKLK
ncbi:MAG: pitrilysin family protein [Candidatus Eisenbacteria bacterium]|nr:pitrilysin family protein [Candidatus Eisenbacteria bacterium]